MKKFFYCLFVLMATVALAFGQTDIAFYKNIRLSPMPASILNVTAAGQNLDGQWDFHILEQKQRHKIEVPGEWEMQGYSVNEGETAIYSKRLQIPGDWKGKKIKLRFDGVSSHALVKINGQEVAQHEGSFVPFETDITRYLTETDNMLTVEVQANTISDKLACTSQYAAHTVGGLLRDVHLFALPEINLSGFNAETVFDKQYENASLKLYAQLANESSLAGQARLKYTLLDENGKQVLKKNFPAGTVEAGHTISTLNTLTINKPHPWNPEHPYLYSLVTELIYKGKVQQVNRQKIGFRQVAVKGNLLWVNGHPVKLHGVNRHSIHPLTGRSVSAQLDQKDAQLFREANCNYIRTSHYPPSEAFLNACDSLGLFVESESSLCWMGHGASPIWKLWNYQDEQYLPYMLRANIEKMLANRSHPSVIIWSLGNESVWSPLWDKVNKMVKAFDPTRATTFHDQCWGGYNNARSTADIAVYHYPGLDGPQACDTMSRPVLFGEYAHISCYNRLELLTDPGIRSNYGKPLQQMVDTMFAHPANLGGAIWSGIDDIFQMPDGRVIGYGPWGPIDAWRRPKPEYWGMKKAYTPIRVGQVNTPLAGQQTLKVPIENRYDFTNLSQIKITCTIDGQQTPLSLKLAPHQKGVLSIPIQTTAREVYLSFRDPRGFMANEEKIILKQSSAAEHKDVQAVSQTENAAAIFVQRADLQYEISKTTGVISAVRKAGKLVLTRGPVFGIAPVNGENGGKPTVANESYQNDITLLRDYCFVPTYARKIEVTKKQQGVEVVAEIHYMEGEGTQSYFFGSDGAVTVHYNITYHGKEIPRQYGLMLQLPESFAQIQWKRKGDFSTYPPDDISRTEGRANLNSKPGKPAEEIGRKPLGNWKDDSNEYGSNDFRATKQAIYAASLSDGQSYLHIVSDGTQSVRSWLQDKRIQLLIADYNSNGSEPFYGSPFSPKELKLKDKTLQGKIIFVINSVSQDISANHP